MASIRNFDPAQEVTIGADTWIIFPTHRKSPDPSTVSGYSGFQGMMFKKIV